MSVSDHFQPGSGERWEARLRAREWLDEGVGGDGVVPDDLVALLLQRVREHWGVPVGPILSQERP